MTSNGNKDTYCPAASISFPKDEKEQLNNDWAELLTQLGNNGTPMQKSKMVQQVIKTAEVTDAAGLAEASAKYSRISGRTPVIFWVPA